MEVNGSTISTVVSAEQLLASETRTVYEPAALAKVSLAKNTSPFTSNVSAPVPPTAPKRNSPSEPKQDASVTLAVNTSSSGSLMVTSVEAEHELTISVATTV